MLVHRHTASQLVALTQKMPVPASVILDRLRRMDPPAHSMALEVCRMTMGHGTPHINSNGDSVIVIIRDGMAITAMLRRSWNQSFDPGILRVDEFVTWKEEWTA